MRRFFPIIALLCGLLLSACSTQRTAEPKRYHTLSQKASTTLYFDQRQFTMGCTVQTWRNELIVLSLQPMLGIEMVRVEATPDSVWVFDKMNRRYTTLSYDWAKQAVSPAPSFKMIQDFVTSPISPQKDTKSKLSFEVGTHKIAIECTFSQREYNTLKATKRIDTNKYKRVSLREVLPL